MRIFFAYVHDGGKTNDFKDIRYLNFDRFGVNEHSGIEHAFLSCNREAVKNLAQNYAVEGNECVCVGCLDAAVDPLFMPIHIKGTPLTFEEIRNG